MRIHTVETRTELDEFQRLTSRVHPRDLAVPLLESTVRSWWNGHSPHPEPIRLLVLRDSAGDVIGRTTVHTDARLDERLGQPSLLFGATDFADAAAARFLLAHLDELGSRSGRRQLFGPVSLLPNQAGGVITSGFEERGFVDSAWNPEWVPSVYEDAGFERWGESDTWVVETSAARPEVDGAPSLAEWDTAGVRLDYGAASKVDELLPELRTVLNASFAALPYFTEITAAELAAATDGLGHLIDERLLPLARDAETGELVSFILAVPDITRFVQEIEGRLGVTAGLRLLASRRRYRSEAILVIQGTHPDRQGRGILTLLSRQLQANLAQAGYRRLRSTYVGRDNPGSTAQFRRFGGRPLHGYTFYRKPIIPEDDL